MKLWLRFLALLNVGNARRRLGGVKAAQTRKEKRLGVAVTSNGGPDHLSVMPEVPK